MVRPSSPPSLHPFHVRHLLPQEQDPLLLQRGLDLSQTHQGPRHLEVRRHLERQGLIKIEQDFCCFSFLDRHDWSEETNSS